MVETLRDADADVIVFNEYLERESFEKDLKSLGYSFVYCASVPYPTALVTRLKVVQHFEIVLSEDRTALVVQMKRSKREELLWVIGTHLNFQCGEQRHQEMLVLMRELNEMGVINGGTKHKERIILLADLNQQREKDYGPKEWQRIRSGMEYRQSCQDDGVGTILERGGFVCSWDYSSPRPNLNWETLYVPATHWSGTVVDYSYGRGVKPLVVSVSPVGWSDHRPIVCDWTWDGDDNMIKKWYQRIRSSKKK